MHESSKDVEPHSANPSPEDRHAQPAFELEVAREELARTCQEYEDCKKKLRQQDQAMLELQDELHKLRNNHHLNPKEAAVERMVADMQRAQEMATMGSWELNVESGEVSWTPELHKMFGQDPTCPVPSFEEQKSWYSAASWSAMTEAVARSCKDGSSYNIELETIRRDGSKGILRSIGEAEIDESGRIVRLRGVAQDITCIKKTEAQLRLALEDERAAQVYKDQFLANMSHEIRTPMNGVVGFASLLRDEDLDAATRNEYINSIESCSNQLLHLIDDILDIAKIQAGEMEIDKKSLHVVQLMHEVAATHEAIKGDRGKSHIRLVTRIPEDVAAIQIYSDPLRIQQILTNLLSNALKFTDQGTIEFGLELKNDAIEFFVQDEGIGIEPERIKLIFERFQHLEGTDKKYEGTGLGLSISKGLAELLGATLTVESELGVGSLFRLKIPLATEAAPTNNIAHPIPESKSETPKACTVLIAEDDETNIKLLQKMLASTPFKILLARNGEQAVQTYREHAGINVVLMDIRMPIMKGDEAAHEVLNIDPAAKIIAQTAYAMQGEREKLLQVGFVDYISKPYKKIELLAMIQKWA
jgi:two-component system CheB/CheR fusion protein